MDKAALDELERVAREATPGPWQVYQHAMTPFPELHDVVGTTREDDVAENLPSWIATYIATFDPPTILALITAARRPALPSVDQVARVIDLLLMDLLDGEMRAGLMWSEKGGPSRVSLGVANEIIAMLSAAPKEPDHG